MPETSTGRPARVIGFIGRAFAFILLALWGCILFESVFETITGRAVGVPEGRGWILLATNVAILAGITLLFRRVLIGAVVTVAATAGFFVAIEPMIFPWLAFVNLLPMPFLFAASALARGQKESAPPAAAPLGPVKE